jgi:integrase
MNPAEKFNLTEKFIKGLKPEAERRNFRDNSQVGFGVRVEARDIGGRVSFYWNQKVGGQIFFRALGQWPETPVKSARDEAGLLAGKAKAWKKAGCRVDANPFRKEVKPPTMGVPTFRDLVENYVREHLYDPEAKINNPPKAEAQLRWALKKYFGSWLERTVDSFTITDVLALRDSAGKKRYMANRLVQYARALFAWCIEDEDGRTPVWPLPVNPASNVKLAKEVQRERVLTPEEQVILEKALDDGQTPKDLADFIKLSLHTGARKSSILMAKWGEIDWDLRQWKIPAEHTKANVSYTVDLIQPALEVLEQRHKHRTTSDAIFPPISSGIVLHIDKPFRRLCARLGGKFSEVHIHDLRRTCGAGLARAGVSLQEIGAILGHSPKSLNATLIYARIAQAQLPAAREAGERKRQELMATAKERMKKQKIHPITKRSAGGER